MQLTKLLFKRNSHAILHLANNQVHCYLTFSSRVSQYLTSITLCNILLDRSSSCTVVYQHIRQAIITLVVMTNIGSVHSPCYTFDLITICEFCYTWDDIVMMKML